MQRPRGKQMDVTRIRKKAVQKDKLQEGIRPDRLDPFLFGGVFVFIYPDNLKAKATLRLWQLRDVAIIGVAFLLLYWRWPRRGPCCPWWVPCCTPSSPSRWRAPASWTSCGGRPAFCSCSSNTMNGGRRLEYCSLKYHSEKDA